MILLYLFIITEYRDKSRRASRKLDLEEKYLCPIIVSKISLQKKLREL